MIQKVFQISSQQKTAEIMIDFHMINFEFALKMAYSNEKLSTFMMLMHVLLTWMLFEKLDVEQGVVIFWDLFIQHSI